MGREGYRREKGGGNRPVSMREKKRLSELESVIARNFTSFYEVGCALREIHECRYYRDTHTTFEEYCRTLWDMCRMRAHQLISASNVVDNLNEHIGQNVNNCLQIPLNEAQARVLSKLSPEDQPSVWMAALKTIPDGGKITALHIKKTMRAMNIASIGSVVDEATSANLTKDPDADLIGEDRIGEKFKSAFNAFLKQVMKEREQNWRHTEKKVVLRFLHAIYTTVNSEI